MDEKRKPRIYIFSENQDRRTENYSHKTYTCVIWFADGLGKEKDHIDTIKGVEEISEFIPKLRELNLLPDLSLDDLVNATKTHIKGGIYQGPISKEQLDSLYSGFVRAGKTSSSK